MTGWATSSVESPSNPNPGSMRPASSSGASTSSSWIRPSSKSSEPAPGRDVDDSGPFVERHVVPGDDAVRDTLLRRKMVEGAHVLETHELAAHGRADERRVRLPRDGPPLAVLREPVVRIRVHGRGDVRRKRPRRRRPDDERLAVPPLQGQAHVERRMLELLVLAGEDLVLGDRRSTPRAPDRRAVALVEPAAPVDLGEEAPDVLDVRVGERVVVVVPVHPHPEPLRPLGDLLREPCNALATPRGELGEAVLLDLALRVEAERLLDLDLDPQPLAVESVLIPLFEAAERLVALEDVLERPPPGVMDAHRVVRGDRPVDEAEARPTSVLRAELLERPLSLPEGEYLPLESAVIRLVRERCEDRRHVRQSRNWEERRRRGRLRSSHSRNGYTQERNTWQSR